MPPIEFRIESLHFSGGQTVAMEPGSVLLLVGPSGLKRTASDLLENAADWSEAKKHGIASVKGGAHQETTRLLTECRGQGLFLVPSGELESWWFGGPAQKQDWISAALTKLGEDSKEFEACEGFIRELCSYFGYLKRKERAGARVGPEL